MHTDNKKKILILTPRFPYPQYGGDALRINEIAKHLKSKGHELVLVSMSDEDTPALEEARKLYDKVWFVKRSRILSMFYSLLYFLMRKPMQCGYYYSRKYSKLLRRVIEEEKPDLYVTHLLRMSPYIEELGLQKHTVVEMTDALSKTYTLSAAAKGVGLLKHIYGLEQRLIQKYEQHVMHVFPKVVVVSQADKDYLQQNVISASDTQHLYVYTNGVDSASSPSGDYNHRKICFMGNMRSLQNQDAARFFALKVFPLIKKRVTDAEFHIVGSLPPANITELASDDIKVTGFVDDLYGYISDSCCNVAPVRVAAGIQNKVLVAMGCGVPVVMSSLISKGIPPIEDNVNCFVCDEPEQIADRCIELMTDPQIRNTIGIQGYHMVKKHFCWDECLNGYENI